MNRASDPDAAVRSANFACASVVVVQGPVPCRKEKDRRANAGLSRIRHDERLCR
jgi:hypothetical protein